MRQHYYTTGSGKVSAGAVIATTVKYIFLPILALSTIIPFAWMLSSSLKMDKDIFLTQIWQIPRPIQWQNYPNVIKEFPFIRYYGNSLKIAVIVLLVQTLTSAMAAFSFTKLDYPGRSVLFMCYLATMMIPSQVTLIPQFMVIRRFGLFNTHAALILLGSFSAFGVFMLCQFFRNIPNELMDAAKIDGAGYGRTFMQIILPLSGPALASLAIMTFIGEMNDFMRPMIYLNTRELRTLTLGLRSLVSEYASQLSLQMAGTVMSLVPILIVYCFAQEQIIKGLAFNGAAVKG